MELPTRSLVLRVCQFRHDRINGFYYSLMFFVCQLILSHFLKILKIFLGTSKNRVKIRFFSQTAYMQNILHQAKTLQPTLINHRRFLHSRAETGFDVAQTQAYIMQELQQLGCTPTQCGKGGVIAVIGGGRYATNKEEALLLRADIDALPIKEKTGKPYACKTGNMHACGHDMHTAMLLGAAAILKNREKELTRPVKLFFQPAEELLQGAKQAVQAGVLQNPAVRCAAMIHVLTDVELPTGTLIVSSQGISAPAADYFTVTVHGKSCHGSSPQNGVDALQAAAHILIALQTLSAREFSVHEPFVLTVGKMQSGVAANALPEYAQMQGTLRAFDEDVRQRVKKRLCEIAKITAKTFRASARTTFDSGAPTLVNDGGMSAFTGEALREIFGEKQVLFSGDLGGGVKKSNGGSEDFAYISHVVPSVMLALAAGERSKGFAYPLHHSKTDFDENALYVGSAAFAQIALSYAKK